MPNAEYIIKRDNCKVKEKTLQNEYTLYIAGRNLLPESINFSLVWELLKRATMVFSNNNPVVIGVAGTDIHISIFIQEPHFLCVESNPVSTITVQWLGTLPWSSRVFWKMQRWNWNELHIFLLCFQVLTYRHWWIGENYVIWTGYTSLVRCEICDHSFCLMFDLHLLNPGRPMHPEGYFRICWELWLQGMSSQFFLPWMGVGNVRIWAAKNRGFGEFGVAAHWRHFFAIVHCLGLEDGLWHSEW